MDSNVMLDTDSGISSNSDTTLLNNSTINVNFGSNGSRSPVVVLRKSRFMEDLLRKRGLFGRAIAPNRPHSKPTKRHRRRSKQRFHRKMGRVLNSLVSTQDDQEEVVRNGRRVKALTTSVKKGDSETIVRMFKIQISNTGRPRSSWKRPGDVPTNIDRITSHDNIFRSAILGENDKMVFGDDVDVDTKPNFQDFDVARFKLSPRSIKTEAMSNSSNSSTKSDIDSDPGMYDRKQGFKLAKSRSSASSGSLPLSRKKITFNGSSNEPQSNFFNGGDRKSPKVSEHFPLDDRKVEQKFFAPFTVIKKLPVASNGPSEFVVVNNDCSGDAKITNTFVSQKTFDGHVDDGNFAKPKDDLRDVLTSKRKHIFKAPALPLCKRPLTRIAPPQIVELDRNRGSSIDTDAISLFAESINDTIDVISIDGASEKEALADIEDEILQEKTPETAEINVRQSSPDTLDDPLEETLGSEPERTFPPEVVQEHVQEWIESSTLSTPAWSEADMKINRFVHNFCRCWLQSSCRRKFCRFFHHIPDEFKTAFQDITLEQFAKTYNDVCATPNLFKELYPHFVTYLKNKEKTDMLINLLNNLFQCPIYDKTPFVKTIISALQDLGYTFVSAIEEILLIIGTQNETLLDILLMLFVEEDDCIESNWAMIPKLAQFFRSKIDQGVVNSIIKRCVKVPENRQLCINVYQDLLLKHYVDSRLIDRNLIVRFVNLMFKFNLPAYAEQVVKVAEVTVSELVANPPPPLSAHNVAQQPAAAKNIFGCGGSDGTLSSTERELSDSVSSYTARRNTSGSAGSNRKHSKGDEFEYQSEAFDDVAKRKGSLQADAIWNNTSKPPNCTLNKSVHQPDPFVVDKYSPCQQEISCKFDAFDHFYHNRYDSNYFVGLDEKTQSKPFSPEMHVAPVTIKRSLSTTNSSQDDAGCPPSRQSSQYYHEPVKTCTPSPNIAENPPDVNIAEMENNDILKLSQAIKSENVMDFLSVLHKYEAASCSKSFIIYTISMFDNVNVTTSDRACGFIHKIFSSLDFEPNVKSALSRFAFNVLPYLDRNRKYAEAFAVLSKFSIDLPRLVEIELIHKSNGYLSTLDLKYAFVFKLFIRAGKLREALKLLKSPEMNLFEKYFVTSDESTILNYKKRIMKEFVEACLKTNLNVAKEFVYFLMLNSSNNDNIDVIWILNELIIRMINKYSYYKAELIVLLENILNGWYKHLNKNVLRALLIQLYIDLPDRKILDIFQLCASMGIYQGFDGLQNCLKLSSSFLKEEIYLILHSYFVNIGKSNCPIEKIYISMDVPMSDSFETMSPIDIFKHASSGCEEMKIRILNVLSKFRTTTPVDSMVVSDKYIVIPYQHIKLILSQYKGGNAPPLCRFT